MNDNEDQGDELMALASIYDEETIVVKKESSGLSSGTISIDVEIPQPFTVAVKNRDGTEHNVLHLPYVVLTFAMPRDYPSVSPPDFILTSSWLREPQLSVLSAELSNIWSNNAGSVILFTWISFLQTETITFLQLTTPLMLSEQELQVVLDHDRMKRDRIFASTIFSCQVCLCEKPGSASLQLWGCDHVFCKACLKEYFEVHIKDGSVSLLKCPEDKCGSQANPTQVKELVSAELFERYDRLLLQMSLDTMGDIIYCPRKACGCPVVMDKESKIGSCASCQYVFCIYCKMAYHGIALCKMKSEASKKIRETYLSGNEMEKQELEKLYGKKQLRNLVEEHFSEEWLSENSKKCPRCLAQVQKIDGCNKMTCSKCQSFFCWLCMKALPKDRPYDHYSDSKSPCHGALFHGIEMNDEEEEDSGDEEFWNAH